MKDVAGGVYTYCGARGGGSAGRGFKMWMQDTACIRPFFGGRGAGAIGLLIRKPIDGVDSE